MNSTKKGSRQITVDQLCGFRVTVQDELRGRCRDFLIDHHYWTMPYMVVNTSRWLPGGKKLVATSQVKATDAAKENMTLVSATINDQSTHNSESLPEQPSTFRPKSISKMELLVQRIFGTLRPTYQENRIAATPSGLTIEMRTTCTCGDGSLRSAREIGINPGTNHRWKSSLVKEP